MFNVIEIVGKRGRTVPVLLTTKVIAWLNAKTTPTCSHDVGMVGQAIYEEVTV